VILVLTVDQLIVKDANLYLQFCNNAAMHDETEGYWRMLAHIAFYYLQELRSTHTVAPVPPILTKYL